MKPRNVRYRSAARRRAPSPALRVWLQQAFWASCLTLVIAAVAGGCWFAYRQLLASGAIELREIAVHGARRVGSELNQYLQLRPGMPLSWIDEDVVEARIAKHPWVKDVEVERKYPHGLHIRLTEREPALLHLADALYVVDRDGVWVEPAGAEVDLPVVTGISPKPATQATERLRALARFAGYWDGATSPVRIGELHFVSDNEVVLYPVGKGMRIHLPLAPEAWPMARERLQRVLREAGRLGVSLNVVDLLFPDRVVARRKT